MRQDSKPATHNLNGPQRATLDAIRRINGYGQLTEREAQAILTSIRQFASLLAHHIQRSHAHE